MAGTKSKSQTQVSERQVPADSAPTARRARMQRLGTYQLQGPSSDENRLAPVAEIASKAYEIMNKEREGAAVVVHNDANTVEEPKVVVVPAQAPAPKPPKAPATPKSESEVKRLAEQKKARAEQSKRDKAKNKAVKEATQKVESGEVRPGVTEPLASEVGTEPKK